MTCTRCGKSKLEANFWKKKSGERVDICRDCLTMFIDNRDPNTFKWILKEFDVPYVEHTWVETVNKKYLNNPAKFGPASVIGTYIRMMSLEQWKRYNFSDSAMINKEYRDDKAQERAFKEAAAKKEQERRLQLQYEQGEISYSEFRTRVQEPPPIPASEKAITLDDLVVDNPEALADYQTSQDNDEEKEEEPSYALGSAEDPDLQFVSTIDDAEAQIGAELTDEDIKYLSVKWGTLYKPSEWVYMEKLYDEYAASYDLTTDRKDSLKKICKTSLKMDQAIDVGDTQDYKNLATVYEQLRKSSRLTEVQNTEEEVRELDSIGELVKFVERKGGIIPQKNNPIEVPQDKLDFTIRDIKNYLRRLVVDEQGLGDIIESFIEKSQNQKTETAEDILSSSFEEDYITQEDAEEFQNFQLQQIEEESQRLIEEFVENEP